MLELAIPVLHMTSADAAEAFYCRQLGFHLDFEVPASPTRRDPCYMGVSRDGVTLHLSSYLRGRPAQPSVRRAAFWSLIVVCTGMWASGPWAPPPPSPAAIGWFALVTWLLVPWAAFADGPHPSGTGAG